MEKELLHPCWWPQTPLVQLGLVGNRLPNLQNMGLSGLSATDGSCEGVAGLQAPLEMLLIVICIEYLIMICLRT